MTRYALLGLLLALAAAGDGFRPVSAEDFRMENKVYAGAEREPAVESTTIFYNGAVYDFLKKPAEITVFDKDHRRFILMDTDRRMKTELAADEVAAFVERFRQRASDYTSPFAAFQVSPKFEQSYDTSSRELTFTSEWMTYRVVTADAGSKEVAGQYRMFADWQARLNTVINARAVPPFGRMVVNEELERREEIPKEVHLTLTPGGILPRKRITVRSEHQLIRQLVESDRARVQQAGQYMAIFQQASFDAYQKIDAAK